MSQQAPSNENEKYTSSISKSLITPFILLVLKNLNIHGYLIMKELSNFGFYSIDQGNFYRTLRKLEKDALITSEWETSDEGPARRVYSITNLGEEYLNLWANSMEKTQEMLNSFMKIYSSFFKQLSINNKEDNNE